MLMTIWFKTILLASQVVRYGTVCVNGIIFCGIKQLVQLPFIKNLKIALVYGKNIILLPVTGKMTSGQGHLWDVLKYSLF